MIKSAVIYVADTEKELLAISQEEWTYSGFHSGGDKWGVNVNPDPGIHIGGYEIEWPIICN